MKRAIPLILLLFAAPLASAGHVVVVSCDGMRPDAIAKLGKEGLPNLFRLIEEGAYTGNARTDVDYTVTLPNHTCMITGRGVAGKSGHNWATNSTPKIGQFLHRNKGEYLRSMFGVAHDHGLRTGLYASKTKFVVYDLSYNERNGKPDEVGEDDGSDKIDVFDFEEGTGSLIESFLAGMSGKPANLSFVHLRDPDTKGHAHGWDLTDGSPYMQALQKCDTLLGEILELIDGDARLKGRSHIIVTADHGGHMKTKTHLAAKEALNFTIPFFVWGPGIEPGADLYQLNADSRKDPGEINPGYDAGGLPPIRNGDAGNLALKLLGLPAIEGSTINARQDLRVAAPTASKE